MQQFGDHRIGLILKANTRKGGKELKDDHWKESSCWSNAVSVYYLHEYVSNYASQFVHNMRDMTYIRMRLI